MSRKIVDQVVEKYFNFQPADLYYELLREFQGETTESITKIGIDKSKFGFSRVSITDRLEKNIKELEPKEDECCIDMGGRSYPVGKKEFVLLKALAVEQFSKCDDYSEVVSCIFLQFAVQLIHHKKVYEFEARNDYEGLKLALYELISDFVLKQLGQNSSSVYETMEEEF